MACKACNNFEFLICSKCVAKDLLTMKEKIVQLNKEISVNKQKLSSLLHLIPEKSLETLRAQYLLTKKQAKIAKDRETLKSLQEKLAIKQDIIKRKQANLNETTFSSMIPADCKDQCVKLEDIRKDLLKKAAKTFEINAYFPEYCISDMFKVEKCMRYSQIIKDDSENVSIDKPNFVISLRNMIISYQSDEHNQAVNYSISQIAFFINAAALILNFDLIFKLKYKYNYFVVKDFAGTQVAMNILEPYECENALIYLYEDLRLLQQHSGVDFSKTQGIFDINSLINSPFVGRYFDIPSCPDPIQKLNSKAEKIYTKNEPDEDEWEFIEDSD